MKRAHAAAGARMRGPRALSAPRALLLAVAIAAAAAAAETPATGPPPPPPEWPQWRGPLGTGEAPAGDPPLEWSESKGVRWKTALPGKGHSTPVVAGERVFLTAAEPFGEPIPPRPDPAPGAHDNVPISHRQRFLVIAVNRETGVIDWRSTAREDLPNEGAHYSASYASASPVTDGDLVVASFGSRGVYCFDLDGKLLWKRDLGRLQTKHGHGEGSSPVLHRDLVVINQDHEGQSFVEALDKRAGTTVWRVERDEATSWATPIVVEHDGKPQLVVSGTGRVRGYDLATGQVIWACGGLSENIVASPVAADGMVFAGSSYEKKALLAIRLEGARGDLTGGDRIVWRTDRSTPYVPSPLLYRGALYFLQHYQEILTSVDARTGRPRHRPVRLDAIRNVYASPVAAAGRVYITDLDGTTVVIDHETPTRVLAVNRLDETFSASAAIAGKDIFLRGVKYLYCVGGER